MHTTKRNVAVLLLPLLLAACRTDQRPADVMDEQHMANFLVEAYQIEGFYSIEYGFTDGELPPTVGLAYDHLLDSLGLTINEVNHSIDYYAHHPDIYEKIHDSVIARLDRRFSTAGFATE